jgi:hypothetical protein
MSEGRRLAGSIAFITAMFGCVLLFFAPNDLDLGARVGCALFFLLVLAPLLYLKTRGWWRS